MWQKNVWYWGGTFKGTAQLGRLETMLLWETILNVPCTAVPVGGTHRGLRSCFGTLYFKCFWSFVHKLWKTMIYPPIPFSFIFFHSKKKITGFLNTYNWMEESNLLWDGKQGHCWHTHSSYLLKKMILLILLAWLWKLAHESGILKGGHHTLHRKHTHARAHMVLKDSVLRLLVGTHHFELQHHKPVFILSALWKLQRQSTQRGRALAA